jgi:hypothetical protein
MSKSKKQQRRSIPTPAPPRPGRAESKPEVPSRIPLGLEEVYREAKGRPYVCFIPLRKEMAEDWVSNHLNADVQRTISQDNVTMLLRLREEGFWTDFKSILVFDTRRHLRNGQHVSTMVVKSPDDKPFVATLMINLPPSDCDSWDQVRKRTVADELKIQGIAERRQTLGAAAKILWQYLHGHYAGMGYMFDRQSGKIASPPEAVRTASQNPGLQECLFQVDACFAGKQFSTAALFAALYILRQLDQKAAETFFQRLNDGVGFKGKDDPIWALRNRFLSLPPKERLRNGETMALVFKAWNLYRAGERIAGPLNMGKKEPFPSLEPMEIPDGPGSVRTH